MITLLHVVSSLQVTDLFCELADRLDRSQFRLHVAVLGDRSSLHRDLEARGVPVHAIRCRGKWEWPAAVIRLARLMRRERVDVLHLHLFEPTLLGLLAASWGRPRAVVTSRHYADFHHVIGKRWHVRLDGWMARRADHVIAISRQGADVLTRLEGVPADKVSVVHYGCDAADQFRVDPDAIEAVRRRYGLEGRRVLGMVGRLHPIKGHKVLLEALASLGDSVPTWKLLLLGEGPLRHELERMAGGLGLVERVIFIGFLDGAERAACFRAMDLLVHPSLEDAGPKVVLEALALGIPVIATPTGFVLDLVEADADSVRVIPMGQVALLTDAIRALMLDPALRARMGAAGRAQVVRQFQWSDMVKAYVACYAAVLARKGAPDMVFESAQVMEAARQ